MAAGLTSGAEPASRDFVWGDCMWLRIKLPGLGCAPELALEFAWAEGPLRHVGTSTESG